MHFRPAATHLLAFSYSTFPMLYMIKLELSTFTPLMSLSRMIFLYPPFRSKK